MWNGFGLGRIQHLRELWELCDLWPKDASEGAWLGHRAQNSSEAVEPETNPECCRSHHEATAPGTTAGLSFWRTDPCSGATGSLAARRIGRFNTATALID